MSSGAQPNIPIGAGPAAPSSAAAREKTAREFEAVFAGQLAQLLLDQVEVDEQTGGGHGEEMFRGLLAEELGKAIGATGALGLSPAILAQIQRLEGE